MPLLRIKDINDTGKTGRIMKRSLAGNRAQSVTGDGRLMSGPEGEGSELVVEALKKKHGSQCACLQSGIIDGFERKISGKSTTSDLTDKTAISCTTCRVFFSASNGRFHATEGSVPMIHISSDYHQFYEELGGKPDTDEKHLRALVEHYAEELGCQKTTVPRGQATNVKCACGKTYQGCQNSRGGITPGIVNFSKNTKMADAV